jgi:MFS transporter, DHA2 family, multidrug resistance protein
MSASVAAVPTGVAHRNVLLLGLGLATGMEFYTVDSMNLVLPDICGALGVSRDEGSWLLTTYSCALFLGVPVCVWLAGHLGYRRYLLGTIALFALASLGCALAPDFHVLLAWRAVQGFAGAGLVVWWRASIYLLLPKPQRSPSLMRASTILYLSSAAGLLLSGPIVDQLNWRLIFLPNLMFAGAASWILLGYFPKVAAPASARLARTDVLGIVLLAAAVISLQVILSRGPIDDWFGAPQLRNLGWLCLGSMAAFIVWQSTTLNQTPLLDIALMRDRMVLSSALLGIFTGMILSGSLYALPEYLRNVDPRMLSATQAGRVMCVYALTAALIRPAMVEVIARLGQRRVILLALSLLVVSMVWFSRVLTTGTADSDYFPPLVLYAFCLSPLLPAVGSGTVAKLDQGRLLDGVSLYMTFRQFGASLGVALLSALIDARETQHSTRLFEHLRDGLPGTQSWLGHAAAAAVARVGATGPQARDMALKLLQGEAASQAATLAYADAFLAMAAVGCVAALLLPIVPPTPPAKKLFG